MAAFNEANQSRLSLKMMLSNYWWFQSASVIQEGGDYSVLVLTSILDNGVKKVVPIVHQDVEIKTELVNWRRK